MKSKLILSVAVLALIDPQAKAKTLAPIKQQRLAQNKVREGPVVAERTKNIFARPESVAANTIETAGNSSNN